MKLEMKKMQREMAKMKSELNKKRGIVPPPPEPKIEESEVNSSDERWIKQSGDETDSEVRAREDGYRKFLKEHF